MASEAARDALESKAKLLLNRERELFELRQLRGRAEEWLNALHAVWPEHFGVGIETLAGRALDLLVGSLNFEMAAALECDKDSGELIFGCSDPHPLPSGVRIEPASISFFEAHPVGRYDAATCEALTPLAERLGYAKFFWRWCSSYRASRFLFLAGSGPRTAHFHTFPDTDRDHFAMFTSHAAALLSNSLLVSDVSRERTELETANQVLDRSLTELEQTQAKLVESTQMVAMASRQAGMAEIATGILHNVGNVLNSVNVCSDVALQHAQDLPLDGLKRLGNLLAEQADLGDFFSRDPRGPKTIQYLQRGLVRLDEGQTHIISELTQLKQHLAHVGAIVSRQQTYAKHGALERCSLLQVMDDALLLARSSHHKGSVTVVRAFASIPEAEIDRHRVLQILVNLISNALTALSESTHSDKQLVAHVTEGDAGMVRLAIEDNGVGIAAEDAPRLFQHGFTTRRDGHGFGLHTSVLTAKELGGQLCFVSAGRGKGATFSLTLPLSPEGASPTSRGDRTIAQASSPIHVQSRS